MLNRLKNFLTTPATPPAIEDPGSPPEPRVDPYMLGLKDAALSGWFDQQNGELYRGFPVGPEDTVLDVGCGNGGNVHFCAMRGARIIVADIDAEKIEATRQRLQESAARSVECLVTDSAPLPIPDASVSRVVSTEVIEHVDDPRAFLAELVRVGQPGALYLLSAPHPSSEELQRGFAADDYFRKPNHVRVIDEQQFRDWVTEAGLEVVSHGQYGFYWSLWMLFFWEAGVGFENPDHPLLHNWTRTWDVLLDSPRGAAIKEALDQVVAKSQVIVARKP
ncbi:class I SAM-dependent methyltransferase [Pseudomonas sp. R3.Fl]|uniref:class I SAM-dependent methyltransferase n=1 Tax=Pseudomonas TaxID=286 RepID=UPI00201D628D|nr:MULTISPECIES: class I SAM-dependent methyltransferase [Pseudomonas]MCL6690048.1 class I SAM-dependent methyltransferase [Pseudomonas sp. R3.Fl]MCP1641352.1 2-polyprenyl-3-methyl-5-hydroxy-6-metoxy-1,4-benzoquinol methylase [Pseudomonas citronellolis]MCP1664270.1 2-polyprenyl-3-methyl-5-hydroxy-6-metoxy-1,4-benzoquinol methylase [Pseudomonas citronellolis]MCP1695244.1 2-polyprenyl-3-methyl-5-hydroxy-6-metoxy-1,4-benzoquinol methylase [Pseudomonas citronellolis]MCP1702105.1 2-polyprenyl-3-met